MSDANERPTCATCAHFKPEAGYPLGTCRRFPPRNTGGGFGGWPRVQAKESCGEHARVPFSEPDAGKWVVVDKEKG